MGPRAKRPLPATTPNNTARGNTPCRRRSVRLFFQCCPARQDDIPRGLIQSIGSCLWLGPWPFSRGAHLYLRVQGEQKIQRPGRRLFFARHRRQQTPPYQINRFVMHAARIVSYARDHNRGVEVFERHARIAAISSHIPSLNRRHCRQEAGRKDKISHRAETS